MPIRHHVAEMASRLTDGLDTEIDRARALYFFVQREIRFGFTPGFDRASPASTLATRRGHCNPQGALFVALCRAAGLSARQHFVEIDSGVLHGVFPTGGPATLTHSYVELVLEGRTVALDGYIADPPLFEAARSRLQRERRTAGYGIHRNGTLAWSGEGDAFVQMADDSMVLRDWGAYDDPAEFYRSERYTQGFGLVGAVFYRTLVVGPTNRRLDRLRSEVRQRQGRPSGAHHSTVSRR